MSASFTEGVSKRERLLAWLRDGDTSRVPVMIGFGHPYLAASYFHLPVAEITRPLAARAAVETATDGLALVGPPGLTFAVDFTDQLTIEHRHETLGDGTKRRTSYLTTPDGTLREVYDQPPDIGAVHREFYVKGEEDFPALVSFFRIAINTIVNHQALRQKALEEMRSRSHEARRNGVFPTAVHPYCAAVQLMSSRFYSQQTAVYLLYDHRELYEELFDLHWRMTQIWLELSAELDADIYHYAINGLEWLSPDIYERYMIPQARRINEWADAHGKLSWIHTCGKKKGLIERDVYRRMGVRIVESLSAPPTGDLDDIAWARGRLGADVTTRGGINCELFYENDLDALKARCHEVLDGCKGYRHMIGDTNPSFPPYDWKAIQVVIDVVRERGQALWPGRSCPAESKARQAGPS